MRVLLDECLPAQLAREIAGHDVQTVAQAGWAGEKNGDLLRLAARDYDAFLTIDLRLTLERQIPRSLIVITLRAKSNRLEALRPLVVEILDALARARPGQRIQLGR